MNRKRNDFECNNHEGNGTGPLTKKIKRPLSPINQPKLNNNNNEGILLNHKQSTYVMNDDTIAQNGLHKLTIISNLPPQSSAEMCHNRKRRSRTSQEVCGSNTSTDSSIPFATTSTNSQSRKKSDLSCVVCCGLAHGYNFDAISCESCKAFFRRNALFNTDRLKCRRDGACDITLDTRRRCKSCRLKKCFTVGMRKEWILTEEEKTSKKRRIEENRRLRLSNTNDSMQSRDMSRETRSTSEKLELNLQNVVLDKINSSKATLFIPNNDTLDNVVTAFEDGFRLDPTSYGWSYPLAKKTTALCQILHTKNTTALRLISFYKRLHEFDTLNEIDKVHLVKNNLPYIFIFHGSLGYDSVKDIYHEGLPPNDTLLYGSDILQAHGDDIHLRCTSIMRSLHSIVEMDRRIMQLALVIMLFSKGISSIINFNEPLLHNYQRVFQIQNFYVEQLWVFLEKCYGPMRAVLTFSTLISKCLLIQALLRDIQQDVHEKVDPSQVPLIIRSLMHLS